MDKHLSWNEDDSKNSRDQKNSGNDPWGNRSNNGNKGSNGGPPDLDDFFKSIQKWFNDLFGQILGKKNKSTNPFQGNNSSNGNNGDGNRPSGNIQQQGQFFVLIFVGIVVIFTGIFGFYTVEPGEQAVEYRFGKYIGMKGPGPHWILPGVYKKEIINTSILHQEKFEDDLITKEVNIVNLSLAVTYNINNIENYLFKVHSAKESLAEATRAAIRQVVAESTLEQVLSTRGNTTDASFLGDQIKTLIEQALKYYQAGLNIQGVEILSVLPPQQVKEAFNDAIQAQEDEIRYQNEAEAYERKIVPVAEGNASRIIQDANTYVAQTVLAAEGDTSRFNAILPEYLKAPQVTRSRMYIDTMENSLKNTPKILVDNKSNNVLFLPLDKMNMNGLAASAYKNRTSFKQQNQSLIDDADISMNTIPNLNSDKSESNSDVVNKSNNSNKMRLNEKSFERINIRSPRDRDRDSDPRGSK